MCLRMCVSVGMSVCRCVGLSVQVWMPAQEYGCVCICAVCGLIRTIYAIIYSSNCILFSPSLSTLLHTTSSFPIFCSSSLFIYLRLVIVHWTTEKCRDLFVSSKRWRLTALNMLRVLHTFPSHTHMHWVRYVATCHRIVIIPVLLEGGALQ